MRLALGTAQFGLAYGIANPSGQISPEEGARVLALATQSGIDTVDTAIAYGESEIRLGEIGIQAFKTITKLPAIPAGEQDVQHWVEAQVHCSMRRLGVPRLYALLLHRPEQLLGPHGAALYQSLQALKSANYVSKIGVSIYSPDELETLIPRYALDLVQAPFNIIDRRLESTGWLKRLKADGVEIHTRSAFLQGLLIMPPENRPGKFSTWNSLWTTWHRWLSDHQISPFAACLTFVLAHSEVDRIVVGVDNTEQLQQLIQASCAGSPSAFPDVACADEVLVTPSRWSHL